MTDFTWSGNLDIKLYLSLGIDIPHQLCRKSHEDERDDNNPRWTLIVTKKRNKDLQILEKEESRESRRTHKLCL